MSTALLLLVRGVLASDETAAVCWNVVPGNPLSCLVGADAGTVGAGLDDIVDAHASVAWAARGRRAATAQGTQAYAVLVSSHFQRFCRELHSQAIDHIVLSLAEPWARPIVANRLGEGRK